MKCEQVQSLLVSYLNHETTPSERTLIQEHLATCQVCQEELTLLTKTQEQISSVLQRRAAQANPSSDAWEHLEARLPKVQAPFLPKVQATFLPEAAQPLPAHFGTWLSRLASGVSRIYTKLFSGGVRMRKRLALSALVAVLVLSAVAVFSARTVTTVSAREILNHAATVQEIDVPSQGIYHIKSEIYFDLQALAEDQGTETILESYSDLQSGNYRTVVTDSRTGKVLDASAYDGAFTYSQDYSTSGDSNVPLTIYRTPQGQVADLKPGGLGDGLNEKELFDQMRNDPNVQLLGKENWDNGHTVYVLQSQQQVKVLVDGQMEHPTGLVTSYFDVDTYKQLGYRVTMEKDGQEILLGSRKTLADEILPAGTSIAWNLSDLSGITIVDDPERTHGDLLPEVISEQELAAKTSSGYLLKSVPAGFSLEISAPPQQPANEPYIYIASYRNADNDYFVIQASGPMPKQSAETYTTASGLVLYFMEDASDSFGKQYISALVEAPNNVAFMINSTLPRETVKELAENLVIAK